MKYRELGLRSTSLLREHDTPTLAPTNRPNRWRPHFSWEKKI